MSCKTCDGTMTLVVTNVFWCPRCGTLDTLREVPFVSKLVLRCREFEKTLPPGNPPSTSYSREWHRLGISESINLPEARPT